MDHIAMDLGSRESQVCVRAATGEIVEERRVGTRSLGTYLGKRPRSRVVLETCAEAFAVADAAIAAGHETVVVPATLAPSLGVGERGVKTDTRDARNLSEASCRMSRLPTVHVPTHASRDRKAMCGMREALIQTRTKLVNTVRGWTRPQGLGVVRSGSPETFPLRVKEHVASRGASIPPYVERLLMMIQTLSTEILAADEELKTVAASDPTCQLLMTAPGVGPVTAVRFAAAVDDVGRFGDAHRLEAYLGLTPGERSSGQKQTRTGVTKAARASCAGSWCRRPGWRVVTTKTIRWSPGPTKSKVGAANRSPLWRWPASSPECCTRCGETPVPTTASTQSDVRRLWPQPTDQPALASGHKSSATRRCMLSRGGDRDWEREAWPVQPPTFDLAPPSATRLRTPTHAA